MNKQFILVLAILVIGIVIYRIRSKESYYPYKDYSYLVYVIVEAAKTAHTTGKVDQSLLNELHTYGDNNFSDQPKKDRFRKWTSDIIQFFTDKSFDYKTLYDLELKDGIQLGSREHIICETLYLYCLLMDLCPSLAAPNAPLHFQIIAPLDSAVSTGLFN